jgi:hypothetical protein
MPHDSQRGVSPELQFIAGTVYSTVVAVLWLPAFAVRRAARFAKEIGTGTWPRANGTITAGDVKVFHGWAVDYAVGRLDYSYRVAGEYYAGSITRQFPDEHAAWDFINARRDKPVVVRYKDDNAPSSALRDQDQEISWRTVTPGRGFLITVWRHWCDEFWGGERNSAPR